jgi:hypothetical protein
MHDGVDFSKYPFPDDVTPSFNTPSMTKSSRDGQREIPPSRQPAVEYHRLKASESQLDPVIDYLDLYSKNATRKALLMHDEMERRYLQPLSRKLDRSVSGPSYRRFLERKERAVTAFETSIRRVDSFDADLPEIPNLRVNASDLSDPMQKFHMNMAKEKRLATIIAQSHGIQDEGLKLIERDTMNLQRWKVLAETRFYEGGPGAKKGRRVVSHKFNSRIGDVLDAFSPNERPPPRKRRAQTAYMIDHLAEP